MSNDGNAIAKQIVWWLTWAVLFGYLALLPTLLGIPRAGSVEPGASWLLTAYIVVPLIIATGIRWLALKRIGPTVAGFVLFLVGLVLVNMSGQMAAFLRPSHRTVLYCLCLVGSLQFVPFLVFRQRREPIDAPPALG